MNQHSKIEVIDRDGWRREYPLQKPIVHIGSDPRNDIVLEPGRGTGVAPLHAQLITSTDKPDYQLVNLGDADILLGLSGNQTLPPRSVISIISGAVFKLGDFILVFYGDGGVVGGATNSSEHIGLGVSLPRAWLEPNRSLDGVVMVRNLGNRGGVQFNLELEGLEPDCYRIEPGPILASGAEKEVLFHLYHRGSKPLAGDRRIIIRATAPRVYPAEQATVSQVIQVLPFFRHKLYLVPPAGVGSSPRAKGRQVPTVEAGPPPPRAEGAPKAKAGPSSEAEGWRVPTPIVAAERAPRAEAVAPPQVEMAEPAPRAQANPPPQAKQPVPETETGPPSPMAAEPTPQTKAALPAQVEEERTPQAKADLPARVEEEETPETEAMPPAPTKEDEWALQTGPAEQVLKLKASPPPETETEQAEAGPPPAEDWWTPEAEAGLEQQVLRLKASPQPQTETEQAAVEAGAPPPAEDWWTPQSETGAPSQAEGEPAQVKADETSGEEERAPETEADAQ